MELQKKLVVGSRGIVFRFKLQKHHATLNTLGMTTKKYTCEANIYIESH